MRILAVFNAFVAFVIAYLFFCFLVFRVIDEEAGSAGLIGVCIASAATALNIFHEPARTQTLSGHVTLLAARNTAKRCTSRTLYFKMLFSKKQAHLPLALASGRFNPARGRG